ncbi:MAG TPA: DUF4783 domain-containing protein [Pelobium sp.]|nr:DUF4783 domain-containing protein [Pelobium sp.]
MKYTFTLLFVFFIKSAFCFDVIDDVATMFKKGDAKGIAAYFSSMVELSISDKEDVYSSTQAMFILKDFFAKNPPIGAKTIHKVTTNPNYKFGVILLTTTNANYRVSVELKSNETKFLISQIRIGENKE